MANGEDRNGSSGQRVDDGKRRAKGIQRVIATDGNGGREDTLQFNVKTARAWVGFTAAVVSLLLVVGGAVMGGVRHGINSEVHGEVEDQIKVECEPDGMIDIHVRKVATELVDEFQEIVEDNIAETSAELQEQHDLGIRLEERQIAMEKKIDSDKTDLIREIRSARGGTS